ncbi:MAG: heparinase II/III family protein [Victivallaceae bacterium]|nr:heparinase II/III family protein [Victivallaceae bacterium]
MKIFKLGTLLLSAITLLACVDINGANSSKSKTVKPGGTLLMKAVEIKRIKDVFATGQGADYKVLAWIVGVAEKKLELPVEFPVRGGQHNQWYQCTKCEAALKTITPTKHQCTVCGKIYSGFPYDDYVFAKIHNRNFNKMLYCAKAYVITGDEKFAEFVKKILVGYAERYKKYPHHSNRTPAGVKKRSRAGAHIYEQTLNEAVISAAKIGPAYDMVANSKVFTAQDKKFIKDNLILPMLRNMDKNKAGKSNWQSWHNAAMITLGIAFEVPEWVDKGINAPKGGFRSQMKTSITADGLWYEGSMGYHYYALSALVYAAQATEGTDIDLWHSPELIKMLKVPMLYAMPDGTQPRFNDSVKSRPKFNSAVGEAAWAALKDPQLIPILPNRRSWDSVRYGRDLGKFAGKKKQQLTSTLLEDSGHAILRRAGAKGLVAAFSFAPYHGFHSHFDIMSFVFFGYGKELGVDPGRATSQAYRLPIHKFWYKGTVSHNTVLVDFKPQQGAKTSKLLFFENSANYVATAAETSSAYPGVTQTRLLVLANDYLLVIDLMVAKIPSIFSWIYHNEGEKIATDIEMKSTNIARLGSGFDYIRDAQSGTAEKLAQFKFSDAKVDVSLSVAAQGKLKLLTGNGPKGKVTERVPLAIVSNAGKRRKMIFAAVIEPVKNGEQPKVKSVNLQEKAGTVIVKVIHENGTDTFKYDGKKGFIVK